MSSKFSSNVFQCRRYRILKWWNIISCLFIIGVDLLPNLVFVLSLDVAVTWHGNCAKHVVKDRGFACKLGNFVFNEGVVFFAAKMYSQSQHAHTIVHSIQVYGIICWLYECVFLHRYYVNISRQHRNNTRSDDSFTSVRVCDRV